MINLLYEANVIKLGHFKLSSGRHSQFYINKDSIYCNPKLFRQILNQIILLITSTDEKDIDIITGPAIAGAVFASIIALKMNKIFIYPEKYDDRMVFRRGYNKIIKDKNVWVVEDIITTGKSVENTIDAIEFNGGRVIGISCIWNRANYIPSTGFFISLVNETIPTYDPKDCHYCKSGIPLEDSKE